MSDSEHSAKPSQAPRFAFLGKAGLALSVCLLAGCQRSAPRYALVQFGPPPADLGAPSTSWVELQSKHFVMDSNLSERQAQEALATLERAYKTFDDVVFPPKHPTELPRIHVVMFEKQGEYEEYAPKASGAYFIPALPGAVQPEETLVLYGAPLADPQWVRIVERPRLHELAHRFIRRSLGSVPLWLNEGLADYYSTLRIESDNVAIGLPPAGYSLTYDKVPKIEELLDMDRATFYSGRAGTVEGRALQRIHYVASWGLVHMLLNGPDEYRERAQGFLDAIAQHVPVKAAFERAYAKIDRAKMDEDLKQYLSPNRPTYAAKRAQYVAPEPPPPEVARQLSLAEEQLLRAALTGPEDPRFELAIRAAAAAAPRAVKTRLARAHADRIAGRLDEAERELAMLESDAPNDEDVLFEVVRLALARSTRGGREVLERYADTVNRFASIASTGAELHAIARYYLARDLPDQGLRWLRRSIERDSFCEACLVTLARLDAEKGDLDTAITLLKRAIDAAPERGNDEPLLVELRRLREAKAAKIEAARDNRPTQP